MARGEGELSRIVRITGESSIVVNLPILTKLNYHLWSKRMQVHLKANGLWDAVQANDDDRRRDRFALSVILGATPEVFHVQIDIADSAKKIWEKLKMMNVGVDRVKKARLQTMRCQYEQLAMGEDEAVVDFTAKVTKVANDIRSIGKSLPEGEVIQKLLRVALEKFDSVTSSMDQFMNLDELYLEEVIGSRVVLEEKLQDIVVMKEEKALLAKATSKEDLEAGRGRGRGRSRGGGRGNGCGQSRNRKGGEEEPKPRDKSKVQCYNCDKYGLVSSNDTPQLKLLLVS